MAPDDDPEAAPASAFELSFVQRISVTWKAVWYSLKRTSTLLSVDSKTKAPFAAASELPVK